MIRCPTCGEAAQESRFGAPCYKCVPPATGANGQSVELLQIAGDAVEVDAGMAPLVRALNEAGLETVASCSGHDHRPGNIALRDGRELIIARNWDEARLIDSLFALDINGEVREARARTDSGLVEAWPAELTPELAEILGRPCFMFIKLSQMARAAGHEIETQAEAEQAFFLHRFLGHWRKGGAR